MYDIDIVLPDDNFYTTKLPDTSGRNLHSSQGRYHDLW